MSDAHKNFAISTVATAPSPATSGTSLVVAAGHGTRFPAFPFNATIWPSSGSADPSNAEVVRVTNVSTDTFTITRAQESTSARTVVVGDRIAAAVTAKTFTDVEDSVATGWTPGANTWVYVGPDQFKVMGADVSARFRNATRVRFKQGGGYKWMVVTAATFSTDTTVTVTAGTDYTIANATITDNYYSHQEGPEGWPLYFTYTPVWTSTGTQPTIGNGTVRGKFTVSASGRVFCTSGVVAGSTTTFGTGNYRLSLPISINANSWAAGSIYLAEIGVADYGGIPLPSGSTTGAYAKLNISPANHTTWAYNSPFTFGDTDQIDIVNDFLMA